MVTGRGKGLGPIPSEELEVVGLGKVEGSSPGDTQGAASHVPFGLGGQKQGQCQEASFLVTGSVGEVAWAAWGGGSFLPLGSLDAQSPSGATVRIFLVWVEQKAADTPVLAF